MKIPDDILAQWVKKYEHGDYTQISRATGISHIVISRAMTRGSASKKTVEAIRDYYLNKDKKMRDFFNGV